MLQVLQGKPLQAKDALSFHHPVIASPQDWEALLQATWQDAEAIACLMVQLPAHRLEEDFAEEKYGNYYYNLHGIIEHTHYHLGQIILLKKILLPVAEKK